MGQCTLQKTLCPGRRRHFKSGRAGRKFAPLFFLRIQKELPGCQQVFGINLETPLDEESDCRLPRGPQIQQMAATDAIQLA